MIGDSKTLGYQLSLADGGYRASLKAQLIGAGVSDVHYTENAINGGSTANLNAATPGWLSTNITTPAWILVNLGTNDLPGIRAGTLTEGAWQMGTLLDRLHAKWPAAQVRLTRVYRSDYTSEATTLNDTWIPNVLTSRAAWAAVGPDERDFLPGNVSDTTHPTPAGYVLMATACRAVMGY